MTLRNLTRRSDLCIDLKYLVLLYSFLSIFIIDHLSRKGEITVVIMIAPITVEYAAGASRWFVKPICAITRAISPRETIPVPTNKELELLKPAIFAPKLAPTNFDKTPPITKTINKIKSCNIPLMLISKPILTKKTGIKLL